ncbi:MAG TPA: hypothetical protein VH796_11860 [Nitrososphaeraceae archaeon]|jgi:hypothetical protein
MIDELRQVCEATDCFKKATERIAIKVGNMGAITLFVCDGCIAKFQDKDK